jgi:hypothetical protein
VLIFPLLSLFFSFLLLALPEYWTVRSSCRGESDYPQDVQAQILAKVEVFEGFVTLNALALGLSPSSNWS